MTQFPKELTEIERYKPYAQMTVASELDAQYVTDRRKEVKDQLKSIEETRVRFTAPILESKRRIDAEAKNLSAPLKAIVTAMNGLLLEWHESQEKIRREEAEKARAAQQKKLEEERKAQLQASMVDPTDESAETVCKIEKNLERLENKPISIDRATRTAKATSYVATYWEHEVVDENLVPDEYWVIDHKRLGQYARNQKEKASIPGVVFTKKKRMGG